MSILRRFGQDRRGSTALLFGVLLLPTLAAAGAALDYARAANVRTAMQGAIDAAALAAARDSARMSAKQLTTHARDFFNADFRRRDARLEAFQVEKTAKTVRVTASAAIKTAMMSIFRVDSMTVTASSEVAWGSGRIELALVLDNTGSMGWAGKMPALKAAANDLLDTLEKVATDKDAIRISIVPFDTQVNVGTGVRNAGWLTFDAQLPQGLETSRAHWDGCIIDRDQPYDVESGGTGPRALYPAARCDSGSLAQMQRLTSNFNSMRKTIDRMTPSGNTNVTIGTMFGLATLSPSGPFADAEPFGAKNLNKIMILLTDGDNTRNRFTWSSKDFVRNAQDIDPRTRLACKAVTDQGIRLYTIRVIEGNAELLRACASTPDMYHEVKDASQLRPVFRKIANEISAIRLTH